MYFQTKLWVFPEGARYNKGCIQPFKKGAFYLAIDAQIPIMPVVFSQYYFLDNESKTFEPGMECKYDLNWFIIFILLKKMFCFRESSYNYFATNSY